MAINDLLTLSLCINDEKLKL